MHALTGKTVAFLVANEGVEQIELTRPLDALRDAGARTLLIAPQAGQVQAFHHLDRADRFPVDLTTEAATGLDFDAVVLPGGVANPDILRQDAAARQVVGRAAAAGSTIAAICHGPWTLIDAGVASGRTLAAYPSLATDLVNAGATWTPSRTHVDANLITARSDEDVEEFTRLLVGALT